MIGRRSFFQEIIRHFWCILLNAKALVISMKTRRWQGNWNSFMSQDVEKWCWRGVCEHQCPSAISYLILGGTWTLFKNNDHPQCAWTVLGGFILLVLINVSGFFPLFLLLNRLVFPLLLFFSHISWCNYGILANTAVVSLFWKMIQTLAGLPDSFSFLFFNFLIFFFSYIIIQKKCEYSFI